MSGLQFRDLNMLQLPNLFLLCKVFASFAQMATTTEQYYPKAASGSSILRSCLSRS